MNTTRFKAMIVFLIAFLWNSTFSRPIATPMASFTPPMNITVEMYRLFPGGARTDDLCLPGDTQWGCTAFCDNSEPGYPCEPSQTIAYPYTSNPIVVPIETDYLLDVLPQEMGTYYHPTALQAQAIAARTYAYWHIDQGYAVNNSNSYHVFVPLKFESLPPAIDTITAPEPCDLENLGASRELVCNAVARRHYIAHGDPPDDDQPAYTEFTSDVFARTESNPTDRAGNPSPYLLGVEDPISTACDANDYGHGHGMSQEGASRWARGHQCSYDGAPVSPGNPAGETWSVQWEHVEQILTHYYTNVHLKNASGMDQVPPYRWLGLWHNIPPDLELDQTHLVTVVAQNSGVNTWYADSIDEQNVALSFQLLGPDDSCLHNCDGLTYHSLPHDVAPGEAITLTPTIYLPSIFPCDLTLRWDMVALPPGSQAQQIDAPAVDFWFYEQWPPWYPLDILLVECPCHVYLPTIQRE